MPGKKIGFLFLFLLLFAATDTLLAYQVSGRVTDEKGEALPYAVVYVKGTTRGTTTNVEGRYSLELLPGKYTLVFQMISFAQHTAEVDLSSGNASLDIRLRPTVMTTKEVTITAGEDPAYEVIRQAIKKRKFYRDQVDAFSCDVYIKGLQRITQHPKKIMGLEVDPEGEIDSTTGIVYLSESVSRFNFAQPDKIKEEMISSKVSGDNKAFSYNQASEMLFNFYENLIEIDGLSERGFVSPISASALFFYKYHLVGTFFEGENMINKIEVTPKRKSDPVFRGYLYIMENSWRIHSTELYLTKDAQIDFVDTLVINQQFVPVEKDVWMLFSNRFRFNFGFMGIKGSGYFVSTNKNYVLNPDFPKRFFNGEEMKVNDDANKKDSAYWKDTRPVPLTYEEERDYRKRDSLQRIRESKPYLDSLDRKTNKPAFGDIVFTGYTFNRRFKKESYGFSPLIQDISFNTVQGWRIALDMEYEKRWENNRYLSVSPEFNYGLSSVRGYGSVHATYVYKPVRFERISVDGGYDAVQFNGREPIGPFLNALYTLFDERNFLKLYGKSYGGLTWNRELVNGVIMNLGAEYADRKPLFNTTDYTIVKHDDRDYSSNHPLDPDNRDTTASFNPHQSVIVNLQMTFRIKQKYYTRPNVKIIIGSKWPSFGLQYRKGLALFGGDTDYDFVKISVRDEIKLKLFGRLKYYVAGGKFLTTKSLLFPDYYHFQGNRTLWSSFLFQGFHLLEYYKYSTPGVFVEAHAEHNFGGFILNKIPLVRKLKLWEIAGVNYIMTDSPSVQYLEVFFGLEKLDVIRVDFALGFMQNRQVSTGLRFGLKI
ncbi:MAG: hypothetical protein FD123_2136 [Bacteroidetes bacterium]|nr:MAG: hypothetical protein FD123_2136 [Bacteroidota bacterium]